MPEPGTRITVDGIEFARLVQFPKIFGAITASFQPPRLILGLLVITALVTFGRVWDGATEPSISPQGLLAGEWTTAERRESLEALRAVLSSEYVRPRDRKGVENQNIDVDQLLRWVQSGYRYQRSGTEDINPEDINALDARYLATIETIHANRAIGTFEATAGQVISSFNGVIGAVFAIRPDVAIGHLADLCIHTPATLWRVDHWFLITYGLFFIIVMALGGGALARMSACQFAGRERLRIRDAVDYATGNGARLVMTPLIPLLAMAVGCVVMIVLGVLMTVPWIDVVGGVAYGLALLIGLVIALLLVGYAGAISLFLPAVAVENCDAGDAAQRAYAYVATRPAHLIGYAITGLIGGVVGFVLISLVAITAMNVTASLFGALTSNSAISAAGGFGVFDLSVRSAGEIHLYNHNRIAAWLVSFWETLAVSMVAAYVVVYYFSASTRIYLLMRRACDGQGIEEIWRPGLVPGTLVPLPDPVVSHAGEDDTAGTATPGMATRAVRGLISMRYGKR